MIDWNAIAERHKRGSTDLERTVTLLCREMAKLVPQEMGKLGDVRVAEIGRAIFPHREPVLVSGDGSALEGDEAK